MLLTAAAMVAFAANSVLCRLALGPGEADAAGFTALRLLGGAVVLAVLLRARSTPAATGGSWISAGLLFAYAAGFSFAYLSLNTGTGALLLFGAVQATLLVAGFLLGERPGLVERAGVSLALAGLVVLLLPGLSAPDPAGAGLMLAAGVAWGGYTLRGRGSRDPLADTARAFARAVVPALLLAAVFHGSLQVSARGAALALASGALASGLGYVVWYAVLPGLTATRAATVQLSVPVLAAAGGAVLLSERITPRLVVSAALVLGGIALAVRARSREPRRGSPRTGSPRTGSPRTGPPRPQAPR